MSVRIQQADDSESEIQEAIFCGLWRVRRRHGEQLLEDKLEAGCAPLALWQAATQNVLPTDSLLPPPIDGLMNGLPLAHELLAHVRNPTRSHGINLTQLPISEADRLSLTSLWAGKYSDSYHWLWRELYQRHGVTPCLAFTLYGHLKGPLLESYEICPIPEVEAGSARRFGRLCAAA